ncbi:MAG: ribonuclease HI family protein [Phycisphaerae bacterium]
MANIDGGSRGNPGRAGAGVWVRDGDGRTLLAAGYFLGEATNNQAEYQALLRALEFCAGRGATELLIHSDSELLVRQLNGEYRVKSPLIAPLFNEARSRLSAFGRWRIAHVPRAQNARADELANQAMDEGADVIVESDADASPAAPAGAAAPLTLRCLSAPHRDVCAAPCAAGWSADIGPAVPGGLCLDAAAVIVAAAIKMRGGATPAPLRVACPRAGCGAEFELRRAAGAENGE